MMMGRVQEEAKTTEREKGKKRERKEGEYE
jgi:hypothetical protein